MMNTQSKKGQDGREKVSLPCSFGMSDDAPRKGTVTSLSVKRCFVKTKAWAKDGMELHVKLWLPEERWLPLRATVLYCMEKVGFELLFDNPTPGETEALRASRQLCTAYARFQFPTAMLPEHATAAFA